MYTGLETAYDFTLKVKRSDIPNKIKLSSKNPAVIGWNTWLSTKPVNSFNNETLDIRISGNCLNN